MLNSVKLRNQSLKILAKHLISFKILCAKKKGLELFRKKENSS